MTEKKEKKSWGAQNRREAKTLVDEGKNWHAACRWQERINFFVEYVNTHTLKTLLRPKEN